MVDDTTLDLAHGTFGTKPVAMLFSQFEQVILVDANTVFLQPPEALFESKEYNCTGTYVFHDRLRNKGDYKNHHEWWLSQLKHKVTNQAPSYHQPRTVKTTRTSKTPVS